MIYFTNLKKISCNKRGLIYQWNIYIFRENQEKVMERIFEKKPKENPFDVDGKGDHCPKLKHRIKEIWRLDWLIFFPFFWALISCF